MGDGFDFRREDEGGGEDVYSKVVRAGRRTYFFDVKATRGDDYYLTITESRKKTNRDGSQTFEKNKIFLYKEDFAKFADGLGDAVDFVKRNKPEFFEEREIEAVGALSSWDGRSKGASDDLDAEFDRL
jgi:hypothetical protein